MLNIPILRWGQPYESLTKDEVVHFATGETLAAVDQAIPGMVTQEDIDDRKEEWGEDSSMYVGSVLGKFPDNLDDAVVPLWAATEAANRGMEPEGPVVLACDVARFGHDKTVVVRRQGPVARIVWRRTRPPAPRGPR